MEIWIWICGADEDGMWRRYGGRCIYSQAGLDITPARPRRGNMVGSVLDEIKLRQ